MSSPSEESSVPGKLRARIEADPWSRALGIRFLDIGRGRSRLALTLQPHMVNFQGYPHGGVIFSLADIAFGAACNAGGKDTVALNMTISFLTAVPAGSRLVAEASEIKRGRRAGFYLVHVRSEDGTLVALVQCVAHRLQGERRG